MQSDGQQVLRWCRAARFTPAGAAVVGCGVLAHDGDLGAALVIAGWALLCLTLLRVLYRLQTGVGTAAHL